MQEGGALFPMQSMKPLPEKAGLFAMPQIWNALQRSTVANSQPCAPVYSACNQGADGGGACNHTMQRGPVWHDTTNPCSENQRQTAQAMQHQAASACNARRSMQIRPESRCTGLADSPYIHHVQRIARAICGHFKRFSGFPVNARQCSAMQSRPPAKS